MKNYALFCKVILLALVIVMTGVAQSEAKTEMSSVTMLSSQMITSGLLDITGGRANVPVVGTDGTAYVVSYIESANITAPALRPARPTITFQSTINAVTTAGKLTSLTLNGIVSTPVISGNYLVFLQSSGPLTTGSSGNGQLQLDILSLPFTSSSSPVTVTLAEDFASLPVVSGSYIYVMTTEVATSGNKTYLYILNFNGTQVAKVEIQ